MLMANQWSHHPGRRQFSRRSATAAAVAKTTSCSVIRISVDWVDEPSAVSIDGTTNGVLDVGSLSCRVFGRMDRAVIWSLSGRGRRRKRCRGPLERFLNAFLHPRSTW